MAGKIVYCLGSSGQDTYIQSIGGVGTVLALDEPSDIAFTSLMPSTSVFPKQGLNIDRYINSTKYYIMNTSWNVFNVIRY